MRTVIGVFVNCSDAQCAVQNLRRCGMRGKNIRILLPGEPKERITSIPTMETEQPGMSEALGCLIGAALGVAGGVDLGSAAASGVVSGTLTMVAFGMLCAVILGITGALTGAYLGRSLDNFLGLGLPKDELFVYEDALRQGRAVVIALVNNEEGKELAHRIISEAGAESIDWARHDPWIGLRDVGTERYKVRVVH